MKMQNNQVNQNPSPEKPISIVTPGIGVINTSHPEIMDEPFEKTDTSDDQYSFEEEEMLLLLLD